MTYPREGGSAKPVFIAGSEAGSLSSGGTVNTSALFQPTGTHTANSSLSSAATLTPPTDTNAIMIGIEAQPIRLRIDGSAADASTGFLFAAGDVITLQFTAGTTISIIETAASATIQYQWGEV